MVMNAQALSGDFGRGIETEAYAPSVRARKALVGPRRPEKSAAAR